MIKQIVIWSLLTLLLFARENPFLPAGYKSKTEVKGGKFTTQKIFVGSNAQKIKKIVFITVNRVGEIQRKSVRLEKNVIPNSYLHLIHSYRQKSKKRVTKIKPKPKPKVKKKSKKLQLNRDIRIVKNMQFFDFLSIKLYRNFFIINIEDPVRYKFINKERNKFVIDFERYEDFTPNKRVDVNRGIYKSVKIGNHKIYVRIVITFLHSFKKIQCPKKKGDSLKCSILR